MAMSFFHFTLEIGISSREDLFFCFGEHLRLVSLSIPVLGLEKSALGLDLGFFCIIGLDFERCVLDSTSVLNK